MEQPEPDQKDRSLFWIILPTKAIAVADGEVIATCPFDHRHKDVGSFDRKLRLRSHLKAS